MGWQSLVRLSVYVMTLHTVTITSRIVTVIRHEKDHFRRHNVEGTAQVFGGACGGATAIKAAIEPRRVKI